MIKFRRVRPSDPPHLAAVLAASIEGLAPVDYTPAQVAVWLAGAPDAAETAARCRDGRITWIAADQDDLPVGFIDLEPNGHIDLLYVHPDHARNGVANGLFAELEDHARREGVERLYVEASEAARRFFLRQGFRELHRRDFEIGGVPIHNYAMEKVLDGDE